MGHRNLPPDVERALLAQGTGKGVNVEALTDEPEKDAPPESEKAFMARVVALAKSCGWLVYHTHNSRKSEPGFPDLVLVRRIVIFVECKTDKGKLTKEQTDWMNRLWSAGAFAVTFRPALWPRIVAILNGK